MLFLVSLSFFFFFRQYKIKRSNFILFSLNGFELNTNANKRTAQTNSHVWRILNKTRDS